MKLTEDNFILYAAHHYENPHCFDMEEFYDDLKRFKYIKRHLIKYKETGDIKERLVLNHIIVLYNVFGSATTEMLFLKLKDFYPQVKPFLVLLNRMPDFININDTKILSSSIPLDSNIVNILRKI